MLAVLGETWPRAWAGTPPTASSQPGSGGAAPAPGAWCPHTQLSRPAQGTTGKRPRKPPGSGRAESGPLPAAANKVLLERSLAHLLTVHGSFTLKAQAQGA